MPEPLLLPELARSLRSFGAPRDAAGDAAHAAIFAPLLEARARAGAGDVEAALSELRGATLATRIAAMATEAASAGQLDPARARARAARAAEMLDPLLNELGVLDVLAASARNRASASDGWSAWVAQLRRVFESADDACRALALLLAERPPAAVRPRRWFRR